MTRYSKPVWQMIKEHVVEVGGNITTKTAIKWIDIRYPEEKVNHATIAAQMIATSVNHPSAHHYKDPFRFLFYLENASYRLYDPKTDGAWDITDKGPIRIEPAQDALLDSVPFAQVDSANRIILPPEVVQALSLRPRDVLAFVSEKGKITLRKGRLKLDILN